MTGRTGGEPWTIHAPRFPADGQLELARRQRHEKSRQRLPFRKTPIQAAVYCARLPDEGKSRGSMVAVELKPQKHVDARRLGQAERHDDLAQRNARMRAGDLIAV